MSCYVYLPSESGSEDQGGFWTFNSMGESIRDFVFSKAQRDFPDVYDSLMKGDLAEDWWPGKLFDLREVLAAAGSLDEALRLLQPDDEIITRMATTHQWEADLRRHLVWSAMVLKGQIQGSCNILPDYSGISEFPASNLVYGQAGIPDERLPLSARLIRTALEQLGGHQAMVGGFLSELGPIMQVGAQNGRYVVEYHDAARRWVLVPVQPPLDISDIVVVGPNSRFHGRYAVQYAQALQSAWHFCIRARRDPEFQWQELSAVS